MELKEVITDKIERLLSKEFYCSIKELRGKETAYTVNSNAKGPYIKILAYRNSVVVCTSENLQRKVQELLQNKNRDEIFELPLVYGQTIHYVPDCGCPAEGTIPVGYTYACLFGKEISGLAGVSGFENSLAFDEQGFTPTKAVYMAKDKNKIIGIAGAAESSVNDVWEIGIDVLEEYRNANLGTYLVKALTRELLARNIVPFYSASVTNIGSQMVANRCGYIPIWVDTFGTTLDGSSVYKELIPFHTFSG